MAMNLKEIEVLIKEALPDAKIEIQDLAGDGNHYSATVTSSTFAGITSQAISCCSKIFFLTPLFDARIIFLLILNLIYLISL